MPDISDILSIKLRRYRPVSAAFLFPEKAAKASMRSPEEMIVSLSIMKHRNPQVE
jgi:hypothetical protein